MGHTHPKVWQKYGGGGKIRGANFWSYSLEMKGEIGKGPLAVVSWWMAAVLSGYGLQLRTLVLSAHREHNVS